MTAETIKAFQEAIGKANWNMDFDEFCKRTGFVGTYAQNKWQEWKAIGVALGQFDAETLAKITGG